MQPVLRALFRITIAAVAFLPVFASAQDSGPAAVIEVAYFRDFRNLDPAHLPGSPEYQIAMNVYSGLVKYQAGSTEVEPDLAESWEISDDGRTYTFHLRDNVQWHHGYGPFTAHDVKYSFERVLDPDEQSRYRSGMEIIESIEVVDDHTVRLVLKEPSAPFLTTQLAFRPGYIVNQRAVEELGEEFALNPVGTGPYQFVSYVPRRELILEANPDFYRGEPSVKRIVWNIVADENVQALALQRDEINYMIPRDVQVWQNLTGAEGIAFTETPTTGYWQYSLNTRREPLDDVRVRRAIAHAVDKALFVETLLEGQGEPTNTVVSPGLIGHTEDVPSYDYDPERARELLAEAGYPDGFTIEAVYDSASEYGSLMATALQQWLEDIGVELRLVGLEAGAWTARRQAGDYDITISGTTRADPDQILSEQFHSDNFPPGGNQSFYSAVDELIEAQRSAVDPENRREILVQIQNRIAEDVPEIPMFVPIYVTAYRDYVVGDIPNHIHWMTFFEAIEITDLESCGPCNER